MKTPLGTGKGPDLDLEGELPGRRRHFLPAQGLDLNGPVLTAVVNLYGNRLPPMKSSRVLR